MQTPPTGPVQSNYPRPDLANDRQALRAVATAQRQVIYCILGQLGIGVFNGAMAATQIPALAILTLVLVVGILIFTIMSVIKLANALNLTAVLYIVLMFIPCVSLITLLVLSDKATKFLRQAGIKVGLMGADPNSI